MGGGWASLNNVLCKTAKVRDLALIDPNESLKYPVPVELGMILNSFWPDTEAAVRRCSSKYASFKILQKSQEKTCFGVSILIK